MSSEIFGSCDERELLWQSWMDARCMLQFAHGGALQFARSKERATRKALNAHMAKHQCGLPVAEPGLAVAAKAS